MHLGRRGAADNEPVHLELHHGDIHWTLDFPVDARGLRSHYGERLRHADEVILRALMFQEMWTLGASRRKAPAKWGDSSTE